MVRIDRREDSEKRILRCSEIQKYYVFFYEVRNGRRIIGKNKRY